MILDARRSDRLTPRLALIALLTGPTASWQAPLTTPLALDLIGSMVAVNGATLTLATRESELARVLVDDIPAGVDLMIDAVASDAELACALVESLTARGFARIVVIASDTIGVSSRIMTTALSALAGEDTVAGLTPHGELYLAGQTAGDANRPLFDGLDWTPETSGPAPRGRGLERRARARDFAGLDELRRAVEGFERQHPRLLDVLSRAV